MSSLFKKAPCFFQKTTNLTFGLCEKTLWQKRAGGFLVAEDLIGKRKMQPLTFKKYLNQDNS